MYTIKTENFYLELVPVADSIIVKICCDGFSGNACFDTEDVLIADFAFQLNEMYKKLEGLAKFQDLYETDSYIEFVAHKLGHITVRGKIVSIRHRHIQQLTFENDFDQTYLLDFVMALVVDYSRYVE